MVRNFFIILGYGLVMLGIGYGLGTENQPDRIRPVTTTTTTPPRTIGYSCVEGAHVWESWNGDIEIVPAGSSC